jgi:hypothetical protein
MSERLNTCPACQSRRVRVVKILNPDTTDMNANADLKCEDCQHEWVGRVTSPLYERLRRQGRIR